MTLQEIANKMARHLKRQKQQCHNGTKCVYRLETSSGRCENRCVFGALIPKRKYNDDFECGDINYLIKSYPTILVDLNLPEDAKSVTFYRAAQDIHDGSWEIRNDEFRKLCDRNGLDYNPN